MVKSVVVDTSAILPLFLPDECSAYARRILTLRDSTPLVSTTLIKIEFCNALLIAHRRGRITSAEVAYAHNFFSTLEVELIDNVSGSSVYGTHELAVRRSLSIYDALYLSLAMEEGAALATRDSALRNAAIAEGVEVIE